MAMLSHFTYKPAKKNLFKSMINEIRKINEIEDDKIIKGKRNLVRLKRKIQASSFSLGSFVKIFDLPKVSKIAHNLDLPKVS